MYLIDPHELRTLISTCGLPLEELARHARVPRKLLQALLAGDTATCSYGPARRLEDSLGIEPGQLFVSDIDRDTHIVRRLQAG